MSLNIKNPETEQLARELARCTGESLTQAVTIAIQERLERQKPNPKAGLADWIMKLSEKTAPLMNDGKTSTELIDELYDPRTGLPL